MLTLYAITYNMILRVQVQGLTTFQYTMFIFAGLVPFLSTAEALGHGVNSVAGNRTLLTNTVFPIDLAPVKSVLLSQVVMTVGATVPELHESILVIGAAGFTAMTQAEKFMIATEYRPFVNEDAKYRFKFNSGTLQNEAIRLRGKVVRIKKYGWRVPLLSRYENVVKIEEVQ